MIVLQGPFGIEKSLHAVRGINQKFFETVSLTAGPETSNNAIDILIRTQNACSKV
jgi:hypothetical protein